MLINEQDSGGMQNGLPTEGIADDMDIYSEELQMLLSRNDHEITDLRFSLVLLFFTLEFRSFTQIVHKIINILIFVVILGMVTEDMKKGSLGPQRLVSIPSTFTIKILKVATGKFPWYIYELHKLT